MKRHRQPQTMQNSIRKSLGTGGQTQQKMADVGQVMVTYSDRVTCDVRLLDGLQMFNVPVLTNGGTVGDDGKIYGTVELPVERDYIVILFIGGRPMVIGTFLPFLNELFQEDKQVLAGPDMPDKRHTLKLLEKDKPLSYKKVFPSGTTIEVNEEGSVYLETVDLGAFVLYIDPNDSDNSYVEWKSADDDMGRYCRIRMKSTTDGLVIEDQINDNELKMNSDGYEIEDTNNNRIEARDTGITITDTNGNEISMEPNQVEINSNFRVLQ